MEKWIPLNINRLFEVSNKGRIRRKLVKRNPYMYYKLDTTHQGYKRVMIFFNEKSDFCQWGDKSSVKKRFQVHRLVAEHFIPNPEGKPQFNHIDCNPSNNNVENLEWVTESENLSYAYKMGRVSKAGVKNSIAKLCDSDIVEIRSLYRHGGIFQREIANKFGVTPSLISMIVNNKIWTHL